MTDRQFHDAGLRENAIPVEMSRASLTNQRLTRDFESSWRFYDGVGSGKPATRPAADANAPKARADAGRDGAPPARVYKDRVEPHWFAGDTRFWYRNDLPRGRREFVLVDAAKGTREPAFDRERLARA